MSPAQGQNRSMRHAGRSSDAFRAYSDQPRTASGTLSCIARDAIARERPRAPASEGLGHVAGVKESPKYDVPRSQIFAHQHHWFDGWPWLASWATWMPVQ